MAGLEGIKTRLIIPLWGDKNIFDINPILFFYPE